MIECAYNYSQNFHAVALKENHKIIMVDVRHVDRVGLSKPCVSCYLRGHSRHHSQGRNVTESREHLSHSYATKVASIKRLYTFVCENQNLSGCNSVKLVDTAIQYAIDSSSFTNAAAQHSID